MDRPTSTSPALRRLVSLRVGLATAFVVLVLATSAVLCAVLLQRMRAVMREDLRTRIADLAALDHGLAAIGARIATPRPLDDRIAGCRRLWRRHLAIVVVQAVTTLLAVVSS